MFIKPDYSLEEEHGYDFDLVDQSRLVIEEDYQGTIYVNNIRMSNTLLVLLAIYENGGHANLGEIKDRLEIPLKSNIITRCIQELKKKGVVYVIEIHRSSKYRLVSKEPPLNSRYRYRVIYVMSNNHYKKRLAIFRCKLMRWYLDQIGQH